MSTNRKALVTGVGGQDGSYLAELLLDKDYEVWGLTRRRSSRKNIAHIETRLGLITGDVTDQSSLDYAMETVCPDFIFHLAAQSFVGESWKLPGHTLDVTGVGTLRVLEAMRKYAPKARLYFAGSSEQFGASPAPQSERTPFYPRSPYGAAKVLGHDLIRIYRESYGLWAATGICFNHESSRRPIEFVTRKITHAAASIKLGLQNELRLGNLDAKRDWGFAGDYVAAMWKMLQLDAPEDFVIATGETHTVRDFVSAAFSHLDLDWTAYVVSDAAFVRPAEVDVLCGDASKARRVLLWAPRTGFSELVTQMVDADYAALR